MESVLDQMYAREPHLYFRYFHRRAAQSIAEDPARARRMFAARDALLDRSGRRDLQKCVKRLRKIGLNKAYTWLRGSRVSQTRPASRPAHLLLAAFLGLPGLRVYN